MKRLQKCFVIMPFADTCHGGGHNQQIITKKQWNHIYEHWIKKAVESFPDTSYVCKRSTAKPGNFIKGIIGDIAQSELVIADLTGGRPNVYYELGIRHALRTGSIIITQHLNALPSDLSGYFTFEYKYTEKAFEYEEYYRNFQSELHTTIRELENSSDPSDSPVTDFLGLRHEILERTIAEERQELHWILETVGEALAHNYQVCEEMHAAFFEHKDIEFTVASIIDLYPLEVLYARIFSTPWRVLKPNVLRGIATILTMERRKLQMYQRAFDQVALAGTDRSELISAYGALSSEIVGSRKKLEDEWKKLLGGTLEIKLVWGRASNRRKKSESTDQTKPRQS